MPGTAVPASRAALFERLNELGIACETVEHPAVFTVEESQKLDAQLPGGHTKNLFLKDAKGIMFLIVAESRSRIDLKQLHKILGCKRLSFGNGDLLYEKLGVSPGSVTAFALLNDRNQEVRVVIDKQLMQYDRINCHPLENTATTGIAKADLLRFIEACGHSYEIVDLAAG